MIALLTATLPALLAAVGAYALTQPGLRPAKALTVARGATLAALALAARTLPGWTP